MSNASGWSRHLKWHFRSLWSRSHKLGHGRPFGNSQSSRKVLIISEDDRISQSQVFPFHFFIQELRELAETEIREVNRKDFIVSPEFAPRGADVVCFQTWFDVTSQECDALLGMVRQYNPNAKIVYLDWFAPTDLRLASLMHGKIDTYVKKHVFRDRALYGQPTFGDTNLVDYYSRLFGLDAISTKFDIPDGFLNTLVIGPTFFTSPHLLPSYFGAPSVRKLKKTIQIHSRLGARGSPWYSTMRNLASDKIMAAASEHGLSHASEFGVRKWAYLRELMHSVLCFSPFGYGEVCWRDYEAILCGAGLIKPEMSHVETFPDLFHPWLTYAPTAWDFSDLSDVVGRCLADPEGVEVMTDNAYQMVSTCIHSGDLVKRLHKILS